MKMLITFPRSPKALREGAKNDMSSANPKENITTPIPSSHLLLDMLLVNVSPELVQISKRELALRAEGLIPSTI